MGPGSHSPQCLNGSGACNGVDAAVEVGGESSSALIPMNMDTQSARARLWDGHDWDYRESLSWLRGSHFFQFGGEFLPVAALRPLRQRGGRADAARIRSLRLGNKFFTLAAADPVRRCGQF